MKMIHGLMMAASITVATAPAFAITPQAPPREGNGAARLVDPDERAERLLDRRARDDRRNYANGVLNNSSLVGGGDHSGDRRGFGLFR